MIKFVNENLKKIKDIPVGGLFVKNGLLCQRVTGYFENNEDEHTVHFVSLNSGEVDWTVSNDEVIPANAVINYRLSKLEFHVP